MKILFDQGVPVPLRAHLGSHHVETAHERGWSALKNGELITEAESNGFQVFISTDQNLKYQQNLTARRIAILVLVSTSWPRIQKCIFDVVKAIDPLRPGEYKEIPIP